MNKIELEIAECFKKIMTLLEIPLDDSTRDTPMRVAKMYCHEVFRGLKKDSYPKITTVENKFDYDQMILVKGIKVYSICEHHLVPFIGKATIAYFPKNKVLGLSKFNRVTDYWSRRPQIQERLTMQIHENLVEILETDDVAVLIEAEHLCVKLRGVQDQNSSTTTSRLTGKFRAFPAVRNEFIGLVN